MIPVLYPGNLLAPPSVVTTTGVTAGFPVSRLMDGDISLLWKDNATGTRDVLVDQGALGTQPIDTLLIGAGHSLAGISVQLASGPASGSLSTRATGLVPETTVYRLSCTLRTDRWWRVRFTGATEIPAAPELVLTRALPFPSSPILRGQESGQRSAVLDLESYGAFEWNLVRGPVRWTAVYPLVAMTAAERDGFLAAHRALDGGARACYLADGEGVLRWVNWADRQLRFSASLPDHYDVTLQFREVLGPP